jgi:UDP-N-acetylmuramoylalanine--D-glutamate ligase
VPLSLPLVAEARRLGLPLSNDSQILLEAVPCRVVGITGSAGKTTTTTLVGRIAGQSGRWNKVWVGGNIGLPLIEFVDDMSSTDLAVIELSSFQLELMSRSPDVAAILNITPNHLDRHGTMAAYTAAKARILDFQPETTAAVLGRDDPGAWSLLDRVHGRMLSFGLAELPASQEGTFLRDDVLCLRLAGQPDQEIMSRNQVRLRGEHNLLMPAAYLPAPSRLACKSSMESPIVWSSFACGAEQSGTTIRSPLLRNVSLLLSILSMSH